MFHKSLSLRRARGKHGTDGLVDGRRIGGNAGETVDDNRGGLGRDLTKRANGRSPGGIDLLFGGSELRFKLGVQDGGLSVSGVLGGGGRRASARFRRN